MAAWLQHKEASHKDDAHSVILFRKKLTSKQKLTCDVTVSVTASGAGGTLSGAGNASSASGDKLPKCIQSERMPQANLCKYYTDIWMTHEKKKEKEILNKPSSKEEKEQERPSGPSGDWTGLESEDENSRHNFS